MTLLQALVLRAKGILTHENQWYSWRDIIPKKLPAGVILPHGNQYARNIALKRQLHELWLNSPERRIELAEYYVGTWGGVKRNRKETLLEYATCHIDAILHRGWDGVASWSKVLCIREPTKYAIFDARVSVALNSLQVLGPVSQSILFPVLSSQNRTIKLGNILILEYANKHAWPRATRDAYYRDYLSLIAQAAIACDVCIQSIEMLLFSFAPIFQSEAFQLNVLASEK